MSSSPYRNERLKWVRDNPDGTWTDVDGWVHREDGTIDPIASAESPETQAQLALLRDTNQQLDADFAEALVRLDPQLHPIATKIHELRKLLPALALIPGNPVPWGLVEALAKAAEDVTRALGK